MAPNQKMNPKKPYQELTNEELLALDNIFTQKDLGKIFGCKASTIGGRIKRAKKHFEQIQHPAKQGEEIIEAIGKIIDREKAIQKAMPEGTSNIPTVGSLMTLSIFMPIDIIKDEYSSRKEKLTAADQLRKCVETWNTVYKTFLETEAMNEIIHIILQLLEEVSLPLKELFWEKILAHQKLKFLIKGF